MTKFSLCEDDDPPPNPTAKRPRATASTSRRRTRSRTSTAQQEQHSEGDEQYLEWLTTRMVALEEDEEEEDDGNEEELVGRERNEENLVGGPSSDSSVSITLTDPDVLDCPVCLEPLAAPIFQCENGHIACSSCCGKLKNRCPSCCLPIGYNRCRAIEKVVESAKVSCLNSKYGCIERVSYYKKHEHELTCIHTPCTCPAMICSYVGSAKNLYLHHATGHATQCFTFNETFICHLMKHEKYIFLQEKNEKVIFVVNCASTDLGAVVNVECIGPNVMNKKFVYRVLARDDDTFDMFVQSELVAESVSKWIEHAPEKAFLVIPPGFMTLDGLMRLEMCIKKNHEVPTSC